MTILRCALLVVAWHLTCCAAAMAQAPNDPWTDARFHVGVVAMSPSVSLMNLGIDTNVFAAPDDPQRDFTFRFIPATTAILRIGQARLTGQGAAIYEYFDKFVSERSFNTTGSAQLSVPFSWLDVTAGASTQNTRQREGAEITARVRRYATTLNGGAAVRLSGILHLGVEASQASYSFPAEEAFLDTNLNTALERREDIINLVLTHQITPLTTLRFAGGTQRDRFAQSPERSATSHHVTAGFRTQPGTWFVGEAMVGFEQYDPNAATTPPYRGPIAAVNLTYVAAGVTKLTGRVDRTLSYSYDATQPYYIGTSFSGEVAQHLFGKLDAVARGGRQRLDYRISSLATDPVGSRRDWASTYGAGVAFAFAGSARVRINVDGTKRQSAVAAQSYQAWQFTNSFEYAF